MQTTLRITDEIYRRAKAKSGELGVSLTRFFEEAVEERLASLERRPPYLIVLPVSSVFGPPLSHNELHLRREAAELDDDLSALT